MGAVNKDDMTWYHMLIRCESIGNETVLSRLHSPRPPYRMRLHYTVFELDNEFELSVQVLNEREIVQGNMVIINA